EIGRVHSLNGLSRTTVRANIIREVRNMSFFKRSSSDSHSQSLPAEQPDRKSTTISLGKFILPAILFAIAATALYKPFGPRVLAKTGQQAEAKDASDVDPDAIDAVKKMAAYLHTLK